MWRGTLCLFLLKLSWVLFYLFITFLLFQLLTLLICIITSVTSTISCNLFFLVLCICNRILAFFSSKHCVNHVFKSALQIKLLIFESGPSVFGWSSLCQIKQADDASWEIQDNLQKLTLWTNLNVTLTYETITHFKVPYLLIIRFIFLFLVSTHIVYMLYIKTNKHYFKCWSL